MKILLAEDNAIARKALAAGLVSEGYAVDMAEDGEQALEMVRALHPDFVISDILMPKMDGYSLCQAIREDEKLQHIPVVFYSATFLEPEDEALARSVGASGFIHKDSDPESFQRQLRSILETASNDSSTQQLPVADFPDKVQQQHESVLIRKLNSKVAELEAEKQALRDNQQFLNLIVTTIPDVVFALRLPELQASYIAPEAERLTGYSGDEAMGNAERWLRFIHEDDRETVQDELQGAIASRENRVIVFRMYHQQGGHIWVEARVSIRLDERQEPVEVVGVLSDITNRRESEERLRESERSLQTLFSNLPGMAYRCKNNRDWTMEFLSDGVESLTGYHRNEVENSAVISYAALIHPDDRDMVWDEVQRAMNENRQFSISYRLLHKDGSLRWVWERGSGVEDGDSGSRIEGFITDITLRKRAEERLIESEQRYRHLFEMMESGMAVHELVHDADGQANDYRFLEVNPAFERLTGLRSEQVVGHTVREAMPGIEEDWIADYIRVVQTGEAARFNRYSEVLGRYYDVLAYRTQPNQFVTLFSDVTEQRIADEKIRNLARFPEENPSPVLRINTQGELIYANPACQGVLEHCRKKSGSTNCPDFVGPALNAMASGQIERMEFNTDERHYSFVIAPFIEGGYANLYGRDITTSVAATRQLERLNRVLVTLSKSNRTLVHASSEQELLGDVCDVLTSDGGYPFVWVAYADSEGHMQPVMQCGEQSELMQKWLEALGECSTMKALMGELMEGSDPLLISELQERDWNGVQQQVLRQGGLSALLLLPIRYRENLFGVLGIFSETHDIFDQDELSLLNEMAGDVAFGIQATRTKLAHDRNMIRIQRTMFQTIEAVSLTLEKRDPYTAGHQQRVVQLAAAIASEMGMAEERIQGLKLAALVHDIGKIHIPAEILNRPGRLSETEFGIIKSHPEVGYDILKGVDFDWPIAEMVLQHHERCDGSGYPQGLTRDHIMPEARILGVADVVEAITSHRPYRPGLGIELALKEIESGRGSHYDPEVVDCCLRLFRNKGFNWQEEYSVFPFRRPGLFAPLPIDAGTRLFPS